ncbi:MAG: hypothetical protein HKN23_03145 [Verrucomicrobiales bacterium]|nr:hypothetical protein [Verrucomicrobiales bacterium]
MNRKRQELFVFTLIFSVLVYLVSYIALRETKAYKAPTSPSSKSTLLFDPARKDLPTLWGLRANRFYRPLTYLDRKITGMQITFVRW